MSKQNDVLFIAHVQRPLWGSIGTSGIISLLQCNDSIESHLASIHLSRETVTEGQLVLVRGGLFDLDETLVAQMSVCAKHRHTYGKFWRPRTACQYPAHQGRPGRSQKGAKSRYSANLEMRLRPSNVWCSCSRRFRCVQQIVTFLHTFRYITQALKHFIPVFFAKQFTSVLDSYMGQFFFQSLTLQSESSSGATTAEAESLKSTSRLQMGWALQKKHASVRFSQKVRQYLIQKFNIGQETGKKEDPAQAAKDMQTASTIDGQRMFDRTEWLSKC